jgi:hypothetical protein
MGVAGQLRPLDTHHGSPVPWSVSSNEMIARNLKTHAGEGPATRKLEVPSVDVSEAAFRE